MKINYVKSNKNLIKTILKIHADEVAGRLYSELSKSNGYEVMMHLNFQSASITAETIFECAPLDDFSTNERTYKFFRTFFPKSCRQKQSN